MSLASTFDRDSWTRLALCAGHPERGAWFPEEGQSPARAKAICRACPVRGDCLDFALRTRQFEGVWGGTTPYERRRLVKQARAALSAN